MAQRDYYEVLGVTPLAEEDVVRAAYRALMNRYHPDKSPNDPEHARTRVREITEAYATLSDPVLRARYDRSRGGSSAPPPQPRSSSPDSGPAVPERKHSREGRIVLGIVGVVVAFVAATFFATSYEEQSPTEGGGYNFENAPERKTFSFSAAAETPQPPSVSAEPSVPAIPAGWALEFAASGCVARFKLGGGRELLLAPAQSAIGVHDPAGIALENDETWTVSTDTGEMPFFHPSAGDVPGTVWFGSFITPTMDEFLGATRTISIRAEKPAWSATATITQMSEALAVARDCTSRMAMASQ